MAFDTFMVYVGVYPDVGSAEADYDLIKTLHSEPVRERCLMLLLDISAGAAAWFVQCPSAARVADRSADGRVAAS